MAEWTLVSLESGKRDATFLRLVVVVEQEARHAGSLASSEPPDIGVTP
jgi:hypothetical protein